MKTLTTLVLAATLASCNDYKPKVGYDSDTKSYNVTLPADCKPENVSSFTVTHSGYNLTCKDSKDTKKFYVSSGGDWSNVYFSEADAKLKPSN